jgi:hypothetical protein
VRSPSQWRKRHEKHTLWVSLTFWDIAPGPGSRHRQVWHWAGLRLWAKPSKSLGGLVDPHANHAATLTHSSQLGRDLGDLHARHFPHMEMPQFGQLPISIWNCLVSSPYLELLHWSAPKFGIAPIGSVSIYGIAPNWVGSQIWYCPNWVSPHIWNWSRSLAPSQSPSSHAPSYPGMLPCIYNITFWQHPGRNRLGDGHGTFSYIYIETRRTRSSYLFFSFLFPLACIRVLLVSIHSHATIVLDTAWSSSRLRPTLSVNALDGYRWRQGNWHRSPGPGRSFTTGGKHGDARIWRTDDGPGVFYVELTKVHVYQCAYSDFTAG